MKNVISLFAVAGLAMLFAAGCGKSNEDKAKEHCEALAKDKCVSTGLDKDVAKEFECAVEKDKCTAKALKKD